ncbi:hypothetical protein P9139_19200 [Curtobacterium flaccumfaciens]|nr:hypothetical protein P9139_19200 [Curtobacterium flaccumfaciens]
MTTPFLRWFGYRPVIVVSSAVAALSVVAMVFMTEDTRSGSSPCCSW